MHRWKKMQIDDESHDRRMRILRQIEGGVAEAIGRLRRAMRGEENLLNDHALRACIALARMARLMIVKVETIEPERSIAHPDNSPEEVERLILALEASASKHEAQKHWTESITQDLAAKLPSSVHRPA